MDEMDFGNNEMEKKTICCSLRQLLGICLNEYHTGKLIYGNINDLESGSWTSFNATHWAQRKERGPSTGHQSKIEHVNLARGMIQQTVTRCLCAFTIYIDIVFWIKTCSADLSII